MPDVFTPLSQVQFVEQLVCDRYRVKIPKFLAEAHQWWPTWEKERFASMEKELRQGDVLFDIGAETGWQSAIYAQFVGAKNMVLIEPTAQNWPAIKATWEANGLENPKSTAIGFLSDRDEHGELFIGEHRGWIKEAYAEELLTNTKFSHIDENGGTIGQATLDRFVEMSSICPNAITIDVEGFELAVLCGAKGILQFVRPLVWVSLHEGLTRPGVNPKNEDVINFMAKQGYDGIKLGVDHEAHWIFRP